MGQSLDLESRTYMVCIALTTVMMASLAYNNSIQPHENVYAQTQEQNQSS
jgi:hypothetical protein